MTENNFKKHPKKSDITRERILNAATKVFARESYLAASIRMIARDGGFDHGIIRYYYQNKASLFIAVSEKICGEILKETSSWFAAVKQGMEIEEAFSAYLDRFLGYSFKNPDPFRIIMQNIPQDDKNEPTPGYENMISLLETSRKIFEEKISLSASPEEIGIFISCFNTITFNYIGSSSSQARLLNMEPESREYRDWVKNALMFIFLPRLKYLTGL